MCVEASHCGALSCCRAWALGTQASVITVHQPSSQRRQWHPTPVLSPGKSHGWRSLVGYSPWGRYEGTPVGQTWLAQPRFLLHNPPSPTTNGHGGMAGDQRAFIDGHSTTLPGLLHGRPSTSPFPTRTPIPAYCKAPSSTSVSWLCS